MCISDSGLHCGGSGSQSVPPIMCVCESPGRITVSLTHRLPVGMWFCSAISVTHTHTCGHQRSAGLSCSGLIAEALRTRFSWRDLQVSGVAPLFKASQYGSTHTHACGGTLIHLFITHWIFKEHWGGWKPVLHALCLLLYSIISRGGCWKTTHVQFYTYTHETETPHQSGPQTHCYLFPRSLRLCSSVYRFCCARVI